MFSFPLYERLKAETPEFEEVAAFQAGNWRMSVRREGVESAARSLHSEYVHEMMHLHLVLVGALFFWPLMGIDPIPGRVAYPFRVLLVVLTLPFHAFLGITIMGQSELLGGDWYPRLHDGPMGAWLPVGVVSNDSIKDVIRRVVPTGWSDHPGLWLRAADGLLNPLVPRGFDHLR